MPISQAELTQFLAHVHPYDSLSPEALEELSRQLDQRILLAGDPVYALGEKLDGIYLIHEGAVDVFDESGTQLSALGPRNSFGERGLMKGDVAVTSATVRADARLLVIPPAPFRRLISANPQVRRFFDRTRPVAAAKKNDLPTTRVETLMAANPYSCTPDTTIRDAAVMMRDKRVSCLCVATGDTLQGILTVRDLANRSVAEGHPTDAPVSQIMTAAPITLPPSAIGSDVLHAMMERHIGHLPIVEAGKLVGIVTQTDLTRFQADSSAQLVGDVASAQTPQDLAKVTARIPQLLVQLVAAGNRHEVVTRLITDIADVVTRRLLTLAEAEFGPPPVPYLWLACGSQGRQEQTGVSDQDNCLILHDDLQERDRPYFEMLAKYVSDGLHICGYVYCPGDMMATAQRWCQPLHVWRDYFQGWIANPDTEAQMLASVMFDLRPIGGDVTFFDELQDNTLKNAAQNSIFVAHMVANSLKHQPPLGLLRGFATVRSGEHKNTIDMKATGVVPIVDLGRVYARQGQLRSVNTRARLQEAEAAKVISPSGARDLLDAYDLIAQSRLEHQAAQIKAQEAPDNFMAPNTLSDFERSHLRDAFVVVKTMQSAAASGRGLIT